MKDLMFWREWQLSRQIVYYFLLLLLGASLFAYTFFYFWGTDWVMPYRVQTVLNSTKHTLNEINIGIFTIPIEGEMFWFEEKFTADLLTLPTWIFNVFGSVLLLVFIILLSAITHLPRWGYFAGMAAFIFSLSTLHLDYLGVVRSSQNILLIISLLAYSGVSFFYQSYARNAPFLQRFLVFALLTLGLGLWIFSQSQVRFPVFYLVNYGLLVPIVLTLVFITIVSHDIPYTFFHLITAYNAEAGRSNLLHFSIFTGIYMLNIILLYFDYTGFWRAGLLYLDIYWLLIIATILGIWGFKKRNTLIIRLLPFSPYGAYIYVSLAIVAFSTFAFGLATAHDALVEALRDFAMFSFMAFGVVFYLYIMLNFNDLLQENLPVHKIVYEARTLPYNTLRYIGFIVILGMIMQNNRMVYYQAQSAYYSGIGDAYYANRDFRLAKLNYEIAKANDRLSLRANYGLASVANIEQKAEEEAFYLKDAFRRSANPQAYLRLADLYEANERSFDALFQLRNAFQRKPHNSLINNNLALLYAKNKVADSTIYHLEQADKYAGNLTAPQNNLLGFLADKVKAGNQLEGLPELKSEANNLIGKINKLAVYNKYKTNLPFGASQAKNQDAEQSFAYMYNFALNKMGNTDTLANMLIKNFVKADKDLKFADQTRFVEACYEYYRGNVEVGIQLLAGIPSIERNAYYNTVLGLWFLEQNNFGNAQSYFQKSIDLNNQLAIFYQAIAQSEAGDFGKAAQSWLAVAQQKEQPQENIAIAAKMLRVLGDSVKLQDDTDRYHLIHYKRRLLPADYLEDIYNEIKDIQLKTKAAADLMNYFMDNKDIARTNNLYQTLKPNESKVALATRSEINHAYMRLLLVSGENQKLLNEIDNLQLLNYHRNKKMFFRAMALRNLSDFKNAETYFNQAILATPFEENVIIEAADFYQRQKRNADKAYQILVNGVRGNAFSLPMYKAYTLQCLEVGLDNYGDQALEEIRKNADNKEFESFSKIYEARKKLLEQKRGSTKS
jgi:cellulose synthase operon protein C